MSGDGLRHEALLYADEQHLCDVGVPFLREGAAAGELVVCVTGHNDLLRAALGSDAAGVEFVDAAGWFPRPATTFDAYRRFVDERLSSGGVRARVLAEAVWATRSPAEVSEWQRLEAVVNRAFESAPMRVICCYDRRRAPADLQVSAARNHPLLCAGAHASTSPEYEQPEAFIDELERSLSLDEPPSDARRIAVASGLRPVRAFVRDAAAAAGLAPDQSDDVVLAVNELVTNQVKYSGGDGELLAWTADGELLFELRDSTGSRPPALGGYTRPDDTQASGWGLALVRQLAHLVHVCDRGSHSAVRTVFLAAHARAAEPVASAAAT